MPIISDFSVSRTKKVLKKKKKKKKKKKGGEKMRECKKERNRMYYIDKLDNICVCEERVNKLCPGKPPEETNSKNNNREKQKGGDFENNIFG